ncbi:MAG TPA: trypsin-like peptidase domain-containing protein, partial [Thermoanaerobaculia bacterium]
VIVLFGSGLLFGQQAEPAKAPDRPAVVRPALSSRVLSMPVSASARLTVAAEGAGDALAALRAWNAEGRAPYREGFARPLASPLVLKSAGRSAASAGLVSAQRIRVDVPQAVGLRLRMTNFDLPAGSNLWVWSDGQTPIWFDASLAGGLKEMWTPSVWADHVNLAIEASGAYEMEVDAVMEYVARADSGVEAAGSECLIDGPCPGTDILDVIAEYRKAVAHLRYVSGNDTLICTGALVIDSEQTFTPYLLTANHCIDAQAQASSLEAYWDYANTSCNGTLPDVNTIPRTNGSSLLVTSPTTDVTLLRLNAIPNGRVFLGWTAQASAVPNGAILHRISHPSGAPQRYSVTQVDTSVGTCETKPRPSYIYSTTIAGGVEGGSSGSPVILAGGYVVGQLFGHCGPEPGNGCNTANNTVDGAFSASYPLLAAFLEPSAQCSACVPDAKTACLLGNRFKVTMPSWNDSFAKLSGQGSVIRYAENVEEVHPTFGPLSASAFFSMYAHAPKSIESLVRMIKGQNINDKFWVFLTGFTGAEYTIRIEDTQSCRVWQRTVAAGSTTVVKDFEAFPF